ncbi:hypothetical protein GCM10027589_47360 [Actinocorallia lasiicapitis]
MRQLGVSECLRVAVQVASRRRASPLGAFGAAVWIRRVVADVVVGAAFAEDLAVHATGKGVVIVP